MQKFIESVINVVYYSLIIGTLSFLLGFGIYYVGTIKTEVKIVSAQVEELYQALAFQYQETMKISALNAYLVLGLTESLEVAKKEAVKNDDELAKQLLGVDTASKNRDTSILAVMSKEFARPQYDELKSHTVMIIGVESLESDKGVMGTGVVIKATPEATFIVTNKHVCERNMTCYIMDNENHEKYDVQIVKQHTKVDIQILKVSGPILGKTPVKGIKEVKHQDKIYIVGHYLGNSFFYAEGVVAGFSREGGDLVIAAPTGPGNSGSGIITQDGYLSGILYAGNIVGEFPYLTLDLTHSLCVNSQTLKLFLAGYIE